jgi:hypothetical protein
MIKDSAFLRKASAIIRLHKKLESLRQEGKIGEQSYADRRARLDEKALSLKGEHERLLEEGRASIDEGISRLEELSTGGLLSPEKYNSLVVERSHEKSLLESEMDLVRGFGVGAYLDYLGKQVESVESEAPKKVEVKSSDQAGQYAASMDISFMIVAVVSFFILLGVAAFLSGKLISLFSTSRYAESSYPTSTVADVSSLVKVSTTTAGRVVETSTTVSYSTTTKVAATTTLERTLDFTEFSKYERACCITDVGGKLAFIAWDGGKSFVFYDGREVRDTYEGVDLLKAASGSPAYLARKSGKSLLISGGSELGVEYDSVLDFASFGDSVAFVAEEGGEEFVVFDGRELERGKGYSGIANLTLVGDGNIAYIALKDGRPVAVYNEEEVKDVSGDVAYGSLTDVGGKLAFEVKADGKSSVFYDGAYVGRDYSSASSPIGVNGKLAFIASSGGKDFVVYDGREKDKYDEIVSSSLKVIGGKMAFIAVKYYIPAVKKEKEFLVYNDKKFSGEYDSIIPESLSLVNGKPVFLAVEGGRKILVQDGAEVRTSYDSIESFASIRGYIAFAAKKGSENVVFYKGSEVGAGRGYNRIHSLTEVGGKLAFIAETDGKSFVAVER